MRKLLCALLLLTTPAWSKPMMFDLVDVPVDQLLAKYTQLTEKNPKDAQNHYVLGRLNAMAYATHCEKFSSQRKEGTAFFDPLAPPVPPSQVKKPQGATQKAQAQAYLAKAVQEYGRAVALNPKDRPARLGWAWCLDQRGEKSAAIEQYRRVLIEAYVADKQTPLFGVSLTEETGRYLLNLLKPGKDAREIADVKAKIAKVEKIPRCSTPILIPLQPQARFEELVNPQAAVPFDLDGTGRARRWGWITPKAGWLVYLNRRQTVTSGLQMLGSVTFWIFWKNGYQALSALDVDGDGWIRGRELESLALWCDDGDGVCQPGEVKRLDQLGIVGLSCGCREHAGHFPYSPAGVRYADGRRGNSYDWMPLSR